MTIILDKCVRVFIAKSKTMNLKLEFMYMCVRDMDCATVSTIYFPIRYNSCSDAVVYLVIHIINQIRNVWRLTTYLFNFIQDILLKYTNTRYQSFKYWLYLLISFYLAAICITIKSHQSNQTRSTTWRTFMICKYSSYFIPFPVTYNTCICTIYRV